MSVGLPKPELLTVSEKTYENDWWLSGTTMSTPTMTTTPTMCQYAEIWFRADVMLTLNMFTSSAASSSTAYIR